MDKCLSAVTFEAKVVIFLPYGLKTSKSLNDLMRLS